MFRRWAALLVVLGAVVSSEAAPVSVREYAAQLSSLETELAGIANDPQRARAVLAHIPQNAWEITEGTTSYKVDSTWLRIALVQMQARPADAPRLERQLTARVHLLREQAEAFSVAPYPSGERARVKEILSRPEFSRVRGPSWWERLQARFWAWFQRQMDRVFGSANVPLVTRGIMWALIAVALSIFAIWAYRTITMGARVESVVPKDLPPIERPWPALLAEARAAAARGDWREAVHWAYWAAIANLEARGLWRSDHTRTPREYLKLLPATDDLRPPLAGLTGQLETIWYGGREASAASFELATAQLEKLGCR